MLFGWVDLSQLAGSFDGKGVTRNGLSDWLAGILDPVCELVNQWWNIL